MAGAYQFSARLVQDPASWMTAEGILPLTLFGGPNASGDRGMDVAVRSSPIGLGFVDALTDRVRKVQGTIEANVRITGTFADPQFAGQAAIRNGSFLVPVMVIPNFRLLDENGELLRASGRLPYAQVALEYEITDWLRLQSRVSDERPEAQSLFRRSERSALRGIVEFSY